MNSLERCLAVIGHRIPDRVPVIPQDSHVAARLAGCSRPQPGEPVATPAQSIWPGVVTIPSRVATTFSQSSRRPIMSVQTGVMPATS